MASDITTKVFDKKVFVEGGIFKGFMFPNLYVLAVKKSDIQQFTESNLER